MNDGISNLMEWLDLPEEQIWAMGTCTPATVIGETRKGVLEPGADADLVLWEKHDGKLRPWRTLNRNGTKATKPKLKTTL